VATKVGLLSIDPAVTEKVLQHFTTFPRRGLFFAGITISHTGGHNSPPLPPAFSLRRSPAPFLPNLLFFPDSTLRSKDKSGPPRSRRRHGWEDDVDGQWPRAYQSFFRKRRPTLPKSDAQIHHCDSAPIHQSPKVRMRMGGCGTLWIVLDSLSSTDLHISVCMHGRAARACVDNFGRHPWGVDWVNQSY